MELDPGDYTQKITESDRYIWNGLGTNEIYNFSSDVKLEETIGARSPVDVDGELTLNIARDKTLSLIITPEHSTWDNIRINTPGINKGKLSINEGHLEIKASAGISGSDSSGIYLDNADVNIKNQSIRIDGGEIGIKMHDNSDVNIVTDDFTIKNTYRGIAMQAHAGKPIGTQPNISLKSNNIYIDAGAEGGGGIYMLSYHSPGTSTNSRLEAKDSIIVKGQRYGMYFYGNNNSNLQAKEILVSSTGISGHGIYLAGTAAMHQNEVNISAADSLNVEGSTSGVRNIDGKISISSGKANFIARNGSGVYALGKNTNDTIVDLSINDSLNIEGNGNNGFGVYADNASIQLKSKYTKIKGGDHGVSSSNNGVVNILSNEVIVSDSQNHALIASSEGVINIDGDTFRIKSDQGGIFAQDSGAVNLKSNTLLMASMNNSGKHIHAISKGKINLAAANVAKIAANFHAEKEGSISADFQGKESVWTGQAVDSLDGNYSSTDGAFKNAGYISIALKNNSRWNVVADQYGFNRISLLNINDSVVDMTYGPVENYSKLFIRNLTGSNGVFLLNTDIQSEKTDQIIADNGIGINYLLISSAGVEATKLNMESFIARANSGDVDFLLKNEGGKVEAGVYLYELANRISSDGLGATEWYLRRGNNDQIISPPAEVILGTSSMVSSYAMWHGQLSDLRMRMGEVREQPYEKDGFWVRLLSQKDDLRATNDVGLSQRVNGGSIGYERKYTENDAETMFFGVRLQKTEANQEVNKNYHGNGKNSSHGISAYATWFNDYGWYVDSVFSWDWYKQSLSARMTDGKKAFGSYRRNGGGASVEVGKKNQLQNNWFFEPQAQISYFYLSGASFSLDNLMSVYQKSANSLTGRLGLVFGKDYSIDDSRRFQWKAKLGASHEFLSNQKIYINDHEFNGAFKGARIYYGLGVDFYTKNNIKMFAEIQRENGKFIKQIWGGRLGLRYTF
ncbi:autotransporter family protein [Laribacter hongkongensis]|uniref:autotransporter family protein n=1 Tax=Laribacter hongkongensis TaxID=168471 RepID=UPI001EFEDF11|nr:autotransporter outer membrane beta-barrel domain-containing protein [Laribacter hongkongensis]MCG9097696.1 autotransporter outer membrane beta-barrel domain-containing protein [Laribacter hongkongensis]